MLSMKWFKKLLRKDLLRAKANNEKEDDDQVNQMAFWVYDKNDNGFISLENMQGSNHQ